MFQELFSTFLAFQDNMARQRHFAQRGTLVAPWGRGGIGIRRRLKIFGLRDCGFESHRPYHRESIGGSTRPAFLYPSHGFEPGGRSCGGRSNENARALPSAVRKARNAQRDPLRRPQRTAPGPPCATPGVAAGAKIAPFLYQKVPSTDYIGTPARSILPN